MNILVVEDNPINQQIIRLMIDSLNWNCTTVNNGQEAVDITQQNKFDLIFMDLNMPVLDGIEATRVIRQYDKHTPIIAVTAYSGNYYRTETIKAGMNGFISKPFTRTDIYNMVQRQCSGKI